MCVIALSEKTRVTDEMVRKMYEHNGSGAGVAWRETVEEKGKSIVVVKWQKGLDLDEILALCQQLPMPFVAHFRIPTVGGTKKSLCHPFPIEKEVRLDLEGTTRGHVLFHNGHWGDWKRFSLDTAAKNGFKVPTGRWSDSRAMAWAAAHHGLGVLEFIDEKAITFGPHDIEIFGGQAGQHWALANGVLVSNKAWDWSGGTHNGHGYTGAGVCMFGTCKQPRTGGTRYCADHPGGIQRDVKLLPPSEEEKKVGDGTLSSKDVTVIGAQGGSSIHTPFREVARGGQTVASKQAESEEVEESQARMGRVGHEGVRTQTRGIPKTGEALETKSSVETMSQWLAKINVKKYKSSGGRGEYVH